MVTILTSSKVTSKQHITSLQLMRMKNLIYVLIRFAISFFLKDIGGDLNLWGLIFHHKPF